jgi:sugar/nucleoside kinase (ribokinase family)
LLSQKFGFEATLITNVGADFPDYAYALLVKTGLDKGVMKVNGAQTTRFSIMNIGHQRKMILRAKCSPIEPARTGDVKADCWLVSPITDEISLETLDLIKRNKDKNEFLMLDPQGFLRTVDGDGMITFASRFSIPLTGINAIKVDAQEIAAMAGGLTGIEGMRHLQRLGVEYVLGTEVRLISLLHKDTVYWIKMQDIETPDNTGAGDILTASFCCSLLRDKDPVWAISFAAGAVRAALETNMTGIGKIPSMSKIEQNASYFYNTLGFRQL